MCPESSRRILIQRAKPVPQASSRATAFSPESGAIGTRAKQLRSDSLGEQNEIHLDEVGHCPRRISFGWRHGNGAGPIVFGLAASAAKRKLRGAGTSGEAEGNRRATQGKSAGPHCQR